MNNSEVKNDFQFSNLVELLRYRAKYSGNKCAYKFLENGEEELDSLTYAELDLKAQAIAAHLSQIGEVGDRILLLYPSGLDFLSSYFGCLYAGMVAVPAYPPRRNHSASRLLSIVEDANAKIALTVSSVLKNFSHQAKEHELLSALTVIDSSLIPLTQSEAWQAPLIKGEQLCFLQYTSGSTGKPKGVMVSHNNLIHNSEYIKQAFQLSEQSVSVTWLPSFHDMGLIDGLLQPLYSGFLGVLMRPSAFVQKPIRWLKAISKYRATHCGGPNFGYDLCIKKISSEELSQLDLNSWKTAYSGAEPVRQSTLEQFSKKFSASGFSPHAFYPCYGMAETTLMVSGGSVSNSPTCLEIKAEALSRGKIEVIDRTQTPFQTDNTSNGNPNTYGKIETQQFVSCGQTWLDTKVLIVDPETGSVCADKTVGEVWVSGRSVTQGYWQKKQTTEESFKAYIRDTQEGPFLRTGDLGFIKDNELYITGRLKDVVIIRGRNYYPQDIELTVERCHPALRPNCAAAFAVDVGDTEQLIIVQEVERTHLRKLDTEATMSAIRKAISTEYQLQIHKILLLRTNSILKTSSGKIQRQACKKAYLSGDFKCVAEWPPAMESASLAQQPAKSATKQSTSPHSSNSLYSSLYNHPRISPLPLQAANCSALPASTLTQSLEVTSHERANTLIQWLRQYASSRLNSRTIDNRRCIPPYVVLDLGNQGILGMQIPESYGGLGLTNVDALRVIEQLAAIDLTVASFVGVNHALGTRPIVNFASDSVKEALLPLIASGMELASFAITERGAGSNPRGLEATARPNEQGGWFLEGDKIWIGSGSWAGTLNVFVQAYDSNGQPQGITGFIVRQGATGLIQGEEALTMGMRGMVQNEVHLRDVPTTEESILGKLGEGLTVAQDAMMWGRLGIGVMSVGTMKRCLQLMLRYASRRKISTGRLLENPLTRLRMSELKAAITAVEVLVYRIGRLMDLEQAIPVEAFAACKTSGPEFAGKAADNLLQLLGGRGYIESNEAPQIFRDVRLLRIFEGPTETLHMFLGSRILNQPKDIQTFISEQFKSPKIFKMLEADAHRIQEHCLSTKTTFSDRTTALNWASAEVGKLATYAILMAALKEPSTKGSSEETALRWAQSNYDQELQKSLVESPAESALLETAALETAIKNFSVSIGDIEQSLAGEDWQLDELLQQHPPTAPSNRQVAKVIKQPKPQVIPNIPSIISATAAEHLSPSEKVDLPARAEIASSPESIAAQHQREVVQQAGEIQQWIVNWLAKHLKMSPASIEADTSFADYGIDSVIAVDLSFELGGWLGVELEATILWNFPTITALSEYLADKENASSKMDTTQVLESPADNPVDRPAESPVVQPQLGPGLKHGSEAAVVADAASPDSTTEAELGNLDSDQLTELLLQELDAARNTHLV